MKISPYEIFSVRKFPELRYKSLRVNSVRSLTPDCWCECCVIHVRVGRVRGCREDARSAVLAATLTAADSASLRVSLSPSAPSLLATCKFMYVLV